MWDIKGMKEKREHKERTHHVGEAKRQKNVLDIFGIFHKYFKVVIY